jgi:hypothetical protein
MLEKKKIFVKNHLGLGDCIAHNGMVRKILHDDPNCEVYIASKIHNYENISFMYRDNTSIKILKLDDLETNQHLMHNKYDKIISSHFEGEPNYEYLEIGDDAFYTKTGFDPKVRREFFFIERDYEKEINLYKKLTSEIGTEDYIFIHEKPEQNIVINREKIKTNLPIIYAKSEYGFFDLLTIIEKAKEVHVISSCFLSYLMIDKINEKVYAHMYADRSDLTNMIKYNNIDVVL